MIFPSAKNIADFRAKALPAFAALRGADTDGRAIEFKLRSGPTRDTEQAITGGWCSPDRIESQADAGGFAGIAPPMHASYPKAGNPAPQEGWFFYNGIRWLNIKSITSHPGEPQWSFELEPLDKPSRLS
jgi:hypothetical protein